MVCRRFVFLPRNFGKRFLPENKAEADELATKAGKARKRGSDFGCSDAKRWMILESSNGWIHDCHSLKQLMEIGDNGILSEKGISFRITKRWQRGNRANNNSTTVRTSTGLINMIATTSLVDYHHTVPTIPCKDTYIYIQIDKHLLLIYTYMNKFILLTVHYRIDYHLWIPVIWYNILPQ